MSKPISEKLAGTWLIMGAASFEIRDFNDQTLKIYVASGASEGAISNFSELKAPIVFKGVKLGELVIKGLEGKGWQERLETDVAFLLQGLSFENELEELTTEYISAQDQLLALYDLSHSMRHHLTLEGALKALVTEAARLTGAENAFIFTTAPLEEQLLFAKSSELLNKSMVLSLWNDLKDTRRDLVFNSPLQDGISNLFLTATDMAMPEMDGLTLVKEVRANPKFSRLPVIMLTASGYDQDRLFARTAGVTEFLTKPASSREISETVTRLLIHV